MIIANSVFLPFARLSERKGTEIDVSRLKGVFEGLSFTVVVHKDLLANVSITLLLTVYT